jgi:hypothetical protein
MAANRYRLQRCKHGLGFGLCESPGCEGAAGRIDRGGSAPRIAPKRCQDCSQSKGDVAPRGENRYNYCESCWEPREAAAKLELTTPRVPEYRHTERRRA